MLARSIDQIIAFDRALFDATDFSNLSEYR